MMNQEDKNATLDQLSTAKRKGQKVHTALLFKSLDDDAEDVKVKCDELSEKSDNLLANIMKEWIDKTASGVVQELKKTNNKLQKAIREINKDINVAKNVAKTLGYLDEAIGHAKSLIG